MADRQEILANAKRSHKALASWRRVRKKLFRDFCEKEIPRIYGKTKGASA